MHRVSNNNLKSTPLAVHIVDIVISGRGLFSVSDGHISYFKWP
jgi:hypothetical protein